MTDKAAISATYANLKLVPSRKVAQIVCEIPLESAAAFVQAFGTPTPDAERWIALALLDVTAKGDK